MIVRSVQVSGSAVLACHYAETTTDTGSRYEREAWYLLAVDEAGLIDRWEVFGDADGERALARLHELGARDPSVDRATVPHVENPVTRLVGRTLDLLNRGDLETLVAMDAVAEDVMRFDRRITVSAPTVDDSEDFSVNAAGIYEVFGVVRPEPIAVRGDRLALIRLHCGEPPAFTMQLLSVYELDGASRIVRESDFDEDQLDAAFDELDERWISGEGADHEYMIRRMGDFRTASAHRDWSAQEALVAEDFVFVDHRPIGLPENDRAGYVSVMRESVGQTPGIRLLHRSLGVRGDTVLARTGRVGATSDGAEYEWEQIAVMDWAAGLLRRVELFPLEREGEARVRFEELAVERPTPTIDNAAVRAVVRAGWVRRYVGAAAAVDLVAEDVVFLDRKRHLSLPELRGRDAWMELRAATESVWGGVWLDPVAVRGDRLALFRGLLESDGYELPSWTIWECDEAGRLSRGVVFDDDDLDAAVDELNARYAEIRTGPAGPYEQWFRDGPLADFDWGGEGYRAAVAPEAVTVDHRLLGFAEGSRDEYQARAQAMVESVPDATQLAKKRYVKGRAELMIIDITGTSTDGMKVEWHFVSVMRARPDGRLDRGAYFPVERWDDAVAQFEEWAGTAPTERTPTVDNEAVQRLRLLAEVARSDIGEALDLLAADAAGEAHESGPLRGAWARGRDRWHDVLTSLVETFQEVEFEPLAVRGDRVALVRYRFAAGEDFTAGLMVAEVDEQGLIRLLDTFDEDDFIGAVDELEERHRAISGAAYTEADRLLAESITLGNHGEPIGIERFTPDFTAVSHIHMHLAPANREEFVRDWAGSLRDVAPDFRWYAAKAYVDELASINVTEAVGLTPEGSEYTWQWVHLRRYVARRPAGAMGGLPDRAMGRRPRGLRRMVLTLSTDW